MGHPHIFEAGTPNQIKPEGAPHNAIFVVWVRGWLEWATGRNHTDV